MTIVEEMLKDKDIKGWYGEMVYSGVEVTATTYIRRVSAILDWMNETPQSIIELSTEDRYDKMMEFAKEEQRKGRTPSYIVSEFKAIYSYLKYKGVFFKRVPNPKKSMSTPTLAEETIPDISELEKILQVAKPRDKVSISLMAFSGLRPAVIGDNHGHIGLKIGDIDGITIDDNGISMETPLMITVSDTLSKTSHKYLTFLCDEGAQHLRNYLEIRLKDGEKITPASPVVRSIYRTQKFVCTNAMLRGIKKSFEKAGIDKRPYVLRRYFASKMQMGEYKRIIPHSFSQFMMGHKGEMMDQYTLHKGLLSEQIENMRESYRSCYKYLQTDTSREEIEETNARMEKMEVKNDTLEEMLIEKLNEQKKLQEGLTEKIRELEMENHKLNSLKEDTKKENDQIRDELRNLVNTVVGIKKELEKPPEYVEITDDNIDDLLYSS